MVSNVLLEEWNQPAESIVTPAVSRLFLRYGIKLRYLCQQVHVQRHDGKMEVDAMMEGDRDVIAFEIKSRLMLDFVDYFLDDLAQIHRYFPRFEGYHLYGAVAGLDLPRDVARYAYRRGLFVLNITGDNVVSILNNDKFVPKNFGTNQ